MEENLRSRYRKKATQKQKLKTVLYDVKLYNGGAPVKVVFNFILMVDEYNTIFFFNGMQCALFCVFIDKWCSALWEDMATGHCE